MCPVFDGFRLDYDSEYEVWLNWAGPAQAFVSYGAVTRTSFELALSPLLLVAETT